MQPVTQPPVVVTYPHGAIHVVANGKIAGAAYDGGGRWTWWAVSTLGRRVHVASEAEAKACALAAVSL